jgi:hypothetical protein
MPENSFEELKPLQITCTSTNCEDGLHCFKQKQRRRKVELTLVGDWMAEGGYSEEKSGTSLSGRCRACGIDLIDWSRVHQRNLSDVAYTFEALKKELVRHYYWHVMIDQQAKNHALRKGSLALPAYIEKRIRTSVGLAQPYRDGMQTPKSGNIVYYAQHATASCCRACIEEWHKIPRGRSLTDTEINYLSDLATLYINERLPELQPEGLKIAPLRHR